MRPKLVRNQIAVADVLATRYVSGLATGRAAIDAAGSTLQQQYVQAIVEVVA